MFGVSNGAFLHFNEGFICQGDDVCIDVPMMGSRRQDRQLSAKNNDMNLVLLKAYQR